MFPDKVSLERLTDYEKHNNVKKFIFSTPFTLSGSAHGDVGDQFNKKTILVTENSFPFVKQRIKTIKELTQEITLTPIEVAIEDVETKISKLQAAIDGGSKTLIQLELSSIVATSVMAGPLHVAQTFLRFLNILKLNS